MARKNAVGSPNHLLSFLGTREKLFPPYGGRIIMISYGQGNVNREYWPQVSVPHISWDFQTPAHSFSLPLSSVGLNQRNNGGLQVPRARLSQHPVEMCSFMLSSWDDVVLTKNNKMSGYRHNCEIKDILANLSLAFLQICLPPPILMSYFVYFIPNI